MDNCVICETNDVDTIVVHKYSVSRVCSACVRGHKVEWTELYGRTAWARNGLCGKCGRPPKICKHDQQSMEG